MKFSVSLVGLALFSLALVLVVLAIALASSRVSERSIKIQVHPVNEEAVELQGSLNRMQAVYVHEGKVYGVEERSVYVSEDEGQTFKPLGYLPRTTSYQAGAKTLLKDLIAKNHFVREYRQSVGAASLVVLPSGTVVVISDEVYRKGLGDEDFEIVETGLNFLPPFESGRSIGLGPKGELYFGEYTKGPHPPQMRIFKGENDGRDWSLAYTFPSGLIYHVHSIAWDDYRQRFWISTGDADAESHIFYTENDFSSLTRLGGGSQDWRAVALLVREDRLVWGSDDGAASSSIFAWNFDSAELEKLVEIGNPASYVGSLPDGTLLVTTSYIPHTDFGKSGGATSKAVLWASPDGKAWVKALTLDAASDLSGDKRPQIRLPGGDESLPFAFATPLYTMQHNFSVLKLKFDWPPQTSNGSGE